MSTRKAVSTASIKARRVTGTPRKTEHDGTGVNPKSARKVQGQISGVGRGDSRFWLQPGKLFKWDRSPNYSFQLQFKGRRLALSTHTGNKEAAAKIAAGIYNDILTMGLDLAVQKHRGSGKAEGIATVGEWIEAAGKVFDGGAATFAGYARSLRLIAAEISRVKKTTNRYSRRGGNYRKAADSFTLDLLTPEAVQSWRIAYVQKRGAGNPARERAARISCNSLVRQARSLFSAKIRRFIPTLRLPDPVPFAGVSFYPRESMRYQSKIDAAVLLAQARKELLGGTPLQREAFKVMLLALGAGLRRGEIDGLLWRQIDLTRGEITIETTEASGLKSEDSAGVVAIDGRLSEILQGFRAAATGQFVVEGIEEDSAPSRTWGYTYRCNPVFDFLNAWLRKSGVDCNKPLHTLRKESGAMVATSSGIYAASKFLRHADIQVTSQHYADHKTRIAIPLGELMPPDNVVALPPPAKRAKTARRKSA